MTDRMLRSRLDPAIAIDPDEVGRVVEAAFPEALGVWVYGSFATGDARRDSDIDIAILPDRPLDSWERHERAVKLRLGREVDLVDLRLAPPALRFEIFDTGKLVASRDPLACASFETTSISAYQRLNAERRELLSAIRERGTVY
jgi:predicted nucleotidyltransferase